jgi:O-antigen ligase
LYKYIKDRSMLNMIILFWLIFIVIITGSRKGIIILALGTPLLFFLLEPDKRIKNFITSICIILILYWLIMNIPVFYNIMGYRLEALLDIIFGSEVEEASANTRKLFVLRGWNYFLLRPWSGYGLDCFRHLSGSYGTYSHNNYIELLVSGGVPSFIFYYFIRLVILIKMFIKRNNEKLNNLLFVILLLMLILEYGLVSYFEREYIILFTFVLCGYTKRFKRI